MKQALNSFGKMLIMITIVLTVSCNLDSNFDEIQTRTESLSSSKLSRDAGVSLLTASSSLSRVDLITTIGAGITGTVTVEIRNNDGTVVIGSTTVAANTLAGGTATNMFTFSPALVLTPGTAYRIYVTRSDAHNYPTNNYIFWRTSSSGVDAYPGINDVYPSWTLDYGFTTYNGSFVDQQQTSGNYSFFVGSGFYRWQEFTPSVPKTNLKAIDLNLSVGSGTTGTFTVQIRNADGSTVIAENTVPRSYLPNGTNWVGFKISATLDRDQVYRIYVIRSDVHNNATQNTIFWRTSSGGVNAYPDGVNDVYPSWTLDYAFKSYSASGLDQQQTLTNYSFAVGNNSYRWQEFIPRNP